MGHLTDLVASPLANLSRGVLVLSFVKLVLYFSDSSPRRGQKGPLAGKLRGYLEGLLAPILVLVAARVWLGVVVKFIPEPYLVSYILILEQRDDLANKNDGWV